MFGFHCQLSLLLFPISFSLSLFSKHPPRPPISILIESRDRSKQSFDWPTMKDTRVPAYSLSLRFRLLVITNARGYLAHSSTTSSDLSIDPSRCPRAYHSMERQLDSLLALVTRKCVVNFPHHHRGTIERKREKDEKGEEDVYVIRAHICLHIARACVRCDFI